MVGFRGKRGFLKIVEATIAILIIAGVLSFIYIQKNNLYQNDEDFEQTIALALKEISNDKDLRNAVLVGDEDSYWFIKGRLEQIIDSSKYEFDFNICELGNACGLASDDENIGKEIFSGETSIAVSSDVGVRPKKIRLFLWEA